MNLGEINHFLGLPDFKADIMQKEKGGRLLPFWTEFISEDFLISGLYMEEIPSSDWKGVRCQEVVHLNVKPLMLITFVLEWACYQKHKKLRHPQIRKLRIRGNRAFFLFFSLFLLLESDFIWLGLAKEETKKKKNELINLFTLFQWHSIERHLKWLI